MTVEETASSERATSTLRWIGLATIFAAGLGFYWPYFRTFVGTDIAVYWEASRRLAREGHLTLYGNYWDHKPILSYLFFFPFQFFGTARMELLGLKLAALATYLSCFAVVYLALVSARKPPKRQVWSWSAALGSSLVALLLALHGQVDAAHNGIILVAALCFEAAGLMLLYDGMVGGEHWRTRALAGGALIGLAPFWRQTAIVGVVLLLGLCGYVLLRWAFGRRQVLKRQSVFLGSAACACGLVVVLMCLLTLMLGSDWRDCFKSLILVSRAFGTYFREKTTLGVYFTQSYIVSKCGIVFLIGGVVAAVWILAAGRSGRNGTGRALVGAGCAYLALEVALAVYTRKVQQFYIYQFLLPMVFVLGFWGSRAARVPRWAVAGGTCAMLLLGVYLWRYHVHVTTRVRGNEFASNRLHDTGQIVEALAREAGPGSGKRLWVWGDRASLYQQHERVGVDHYDWTMSAVPLYTISDERFEKWLAHLQSNPPAFVVKLDTYRPCAPIQSQEAAGRVRRIEAVIRERYRGIPYRRGLQTHWPYTKPYQYQVYALEPAGGPN